MNSATYTFYFIGWQWWMINIGSSLLLDFLKWPDHHKHLGYGW